MYNLFRFILRYYLVIFFLLLEGFCFYLVYQNNRYHKAAFINVANNVNGRMYESYAGVTDYLYLKKFADSLVAENAKLHAQTIDSKLDNTITEGGTTDTIEKKLVQNYTYIAAKVVRNTVNQAANYIYINRGKLQGITTQMGVINPNGVVGQVVNVTDNYSAVMSLLNKNFKVSAKLKKSEYFGPLYWEGKNTTLARLEEIPKHVKIAVGDTVVTSGFSQLFPQNIMIGRVKTFNAEPDKNFLEIEVELSTNMNSLSYVYVINNIKKSELEKLDSTLNIHD